MLRLWSLAGRKTLCTFAIAITSFLNSNKHKSRRCWQSASPKTATDGARVDPAVYMCVGGGVLRGAGGMWLPANVGGRERNDIHLTQPAALISGQSHN